MNLDVEYLYRNAKSVDYFGLGFIQLKLNDYQRYHFYTDKLPSIMPQEEVHNHRYDFSSLILKGSLNNITYRFEPDLQGDYVKTLVSCTKGNDLNFGKTPGFLRQEGFNMRCPGDMYFMYSGDLHKVAASNNTITLITRSDIRRPYAEVIRYKDTEPVCPFSKEVSKEELWSIISSMTV